MNCSHNCVMCRVWKYIKKHFKNFIIKVFCLLNLLSLFYWVCWLDYIVSWQPYVIMCCNSTFLVWVVYANRAYLREVMKYSSGKEF